MIESYRGENLELKTKDELIEIINEIAALLEEEKKRHSHDLEVLS